jgi:hypothetical protein
MKTDTLIPFILLLAGVFMATVAIGLVMAGNWLASVV